MPPRRPQVSRGQGIADCRVALLRSTPRPCFPPPPPPRGCVMPPRRPQASRGRGIADYRVALLCSAPRNPDSRRHHPFRAKRGMVEAAGIEPASRDAPSWASTRVVRRLVSPLRLRRTGCAAASSTVSRRRWAEQPRGDQPAVCRLAPPQAMGAGRRYLVLRQRGSSACWHLSVSGRIYEVPGPRRAAPGRVGIRSKPIAPMRRAQLSTERLPSARPATGTVRCRTAAALCVTRATAAE